MYDNRLEGTIPTEVGRLVDLEALELPSNQIGGPLPTELGRCTKLREFFVFDNQLTGTIPPTLFDTSNRYGASCLLFCLLLYCMHTLSTNTRTRILVWTLFCAPTQNRCDGNRIR